MSWHHTALVSRIRRLQNDIGRLPAGARPGPALVQAVADAGRATYRIVSRQPGGCALRRLGPGEVHAAEVLDATLADALVALDTYRFRHSDPVTGRWRIWRPDPLD